MAQYTCTQCLQWFKFDELSRDDQVCGTCTESKLLKEFCKTSEKAKENVDAKKLLCKYCQTDVSSTTKMCDKCLKNFNDHGEPRFCKHCKLQSAFIGSKCQRCSSSQKKYGDPMKCQRCNVKAAFDHSKARVDGLVLCWLCYVTKQRKSRKGKRKTEVSNSLLTKVQKYNPSDPYINQKDGLTGVNPKLADDFTSEELWKQLLGEGKGTSSKHEGAKQHTNNPSNKSKGGNERGRDGRELRLKAHENSRKKRFGSVEKKHKKMSLNARLDTFQQTLSAPSSPSNLLPSVVNKERPNSNRSTPRSENEVLQTQVLGSTLPSNDKRRNGATLGLHVIPPINDSNIVVVTELREELSNAKKQLVRKDQQLIEKDKQISMLKVEHLTEIRAVQTKLKNQEEDYLKSMETLRNKNQELLKKIAQISKGKA